MVGKNDASATKFTAYKTWSESADPEEASQPVGDDHTYVYFPKVLDAGYVWIQGPVMTVLSKTGSLELPGETVVPLNATPTSQGVWKVAVTGNITATSFEPLVTLGDAAARVAEIDQDIVADTAIARVEIADSAIKLKKGVTGTATWSNNSDAKNTLKDAEVTVTDFTPDNATGTKFTFRIKSNTALTRAEDGDTGMKVGYLIISIKDPNGGSALVSDVVIEVSVADVTKA